MIEIQNLTKIYRTGFLLRPKVGIENLNLQVASNEVFGFLGQNGAGKTTTIKILVGLCHPTSGKAFILKKNILQVQVRRLIGYVPEAPYFYEYLTSYESLRFYGQLHGLKRKIWKGKTEELLELVGLSKDRDTKIKNFSKGMRQRLGLAQALINDPQLVIMDEPTSGLDPLGRQLVKDIILQLKQEGKTVFFSSHILPDVEAICDRVALIQKGHLIKEGTIDDFLGKEPAKIEVVVQNIQEDQVKDLSSETLRDGTLLYIYVKSDREREELVARINQLGGNIKYIIPHHHSLEEYFKSIQEGKKEEKVEP